MNALTRLRDAMAVSFTERNPKLIGAVTLGLIVTTVIGVLVLNADFFADRYHLKANFTDTAGLTPGDEVKVAGVPAGKVDSIEEVDGKVEVVIAVDRGIELSGDTTAAVQVETVLGTKFVKLETGGDWDHPLEDGDRIERTDTPVEVLDLQNIGTRLFRESDGEKFDDLLQSLADITEGKEDEVEQIITGLNDLTGEVADREQSARRLLDSAEVLTETLAERDGELVSAIDDLDLVVGDLAEQRAELVELLNATSGAAGQIASVVRDNRPQLDAILDEIHVTLEIVGRHQVDLAASVGYLGDAISGFASIGYSGPDNTPHPWANVFTQLIGPTGPDGMLGSCMPVDRFLDLAFGPDPLPCEDRTGAFAPGPQAEGGSPADAVDPASVESLVTGITGGAG